MQPVKPVAYQGAGAEPIACDAASAASVPAGSKATTVAAGRARAATGESAAVRLLLGSEAYGSQTWCTCCCPTLSWEDRFLGFLGCYAIGFALGLSSMLSFPMLLAGDPTPFAWTYSLGNLLSIASSTFLVGPRMQCEQMVSPVRLGATAAYLLSIFGTAWSALVLRAAPLTLLMVIVQFAALGWYCASYIPYGRMCIQQCVGRVCCPV